MNDIAISVKKLSKKYHLYATPQHRLKEALHPFRKKYHRDFWALKDIVSVGSGKYSDKIEAVMQKQCVLLLDSPGMFPTKKREIG